jgi:hypothetical protein
MDILRHYLIYISNRDVGSLKCTHPYVELSIEHLEEQPYYWLQRLEYVFRLHLKVAVMPWKEMYRLLIPELGKVSLVVVAALNDLTEVASGVLTQIYQNVMAKTLPEQIVYGKTLEDQIYDSMQGYGLSRLYPESSILQVLSFAINFQLVVPGYTPGVNPLLLAASANNVDYYSWVVDTLGANITGDKNRTDLQAVVAYSRDNMFQYLLDRKLSTVASIELIRQCILYANIQYIIMILNHKRFEGHLDFQTNIIQKCLEQSAVLNSVEFAEFALNWNPDLPTIAKPLAVECVTHDSLRVFQLFTVAPQINQHELLTEALTASILQEKRRFAKVVVKLMSKEDVNTVVMNVILGNSGKYAEFITKLGLEFPDVLVRQVIITDRDGLLQQLLTSGLSPNRIIQGQSLIEIAVEANNEDAGCLRVILQHPKFQPLPSNTAIALALRAQNRPLAEQLAKNPKFAATLDNLSVQKKIIATSSKSMLNLLQRKVKR